MSAYPSGGASPCLPSEKKEEAAYFPARASPRRCASGAGRGNFRWVPTKDSLLDAAGGPEG